MLTWNVHQRQALLPVFAVLAVVASILFLHDIAGAAQSVGSHQATRAATHMQLRNDNGDPVCHKYDDPTPSSPPIATDCPVGDWEQVLWDAGWNEIRPRVDVTVKAPGDNGGSGTVSHQATRAATHMQLRNSNGDPVCHKYDDPTPSSPPIASDCPRGTWEQVLWDAGWSEIKPRVNVTVPTGGNDPGKDNPGKENPDGGIDGGIGDPLTFSHQATRAATHMQLRNSNGDPVCHKYDDPTPSSPPIADKCPRGTWEQVLWDSGWGEIKPRVDVTVPNGPGGDPGDGGGPDNPPLGNFAPVVNDNAKFTNFPDTPSANLSSGDVDRLMDIFPRPLGSSVDSGGTPGDGNFRVTCQYSHFNYDDPILHPGTRGTPTSHHAHLHMFFGNTEANASTSSVKSSPNFITKSGGGSCNGYELNRSAYWTPAVLDGKGNAVVPYHIVVYYKTKSPGDQPNNQAENVVEMEEGLKLLSGNGFHVPSLNTSGPVSKSSHVYWSCGKNGSVESVYNYIPSNSDCGSSPINATIYFPQCWNGNTDNNGGGRQTQADLLIVGENEPCPSDYKRMPRLGILMYFASQDTTGWRLSSDASQAELDSNPNLRPGGTLHADWMGGWHAGTLANWTEDCVQAEMNCDIGQTGANRSLQRLKGTRNDDFGSSDGTDNHTPLSQYLVPISEIDAHLGF